MKLLRLVFMFIPFALSAQSDTGSSVLTEPAFQVITFDDTGAMSNYIRYDYYRKQTYSVIVSVEDNVVLGQFRPAIPDQFKYKVKVDSNSTYAAYDLSKDGKSAVAHPDSIERIDFARADSFLLHVQGYVYDTIRLRHWSLMPSVYYIDEMCAIGQYYYGVKHGYEETFYATSELKNVLITGPNYKWKARGMWKMGQKDGKWEYFSLNGELERTEKWRNGKLIRTKYAH